MSIDIERGLVPQVYINDENASTSRDSFVLSNSNPRVSSFPETGRRKFTGSKILGQRSRGTPHKSAVNEATAWHIDERIKLVQKGYRSLAIICTFIAGVQAQILSMTFSSTGLASQCVHAFFFAGLLANISAATLSAASARWFEMMTPDEAKHAYDWLNNSTHLLDEEELVAVEKRGDSSFLQTNGTSEPERKDNITSNPAAFSTSSPCYYVAERYLCVALRSAPFVAVLGFVFLVAGVMLWVWTHEPLIVRVLCTAICALLVILLPPFAIPHDRIRTLTLFKLRRFSG